MDPRMIHINLMKLKVLASIICLWLVSLSIKYNKDLLLVYLVDFQEIPMIHSLRKIGMTPQFFHENLIDALRVTGILVNDVWFHSFNDLKKNPIDDDYDESWARNHTEIRGDAFDYTHHQVNEVPLEERTMFVTFSKGYHVSESEVVEFLTSNFGHCVESIHMQAVMFGQQPLYARVMCFSPHFIHTVLGSNEKVKFSVNWKQVWMRKYVPGIGSSSL